MTRWPPLVALCTVVWAIACSTEPEFDLVIRLGTIHDGTGQPSGIRSADVGIRGDRITAIGNLTGRSSRSQIDARDKIVAPGFIDVLGRSGVSLLADGLGESHLRQGITTEILGAGSPAFWTSATADADALRARGLTLDWSGLNGYFAKLETRGTAINIGTLVPLSTPAVAAGTTALDEALGNGAFGAVDDTAEGARTLEPAANVVAAQGGVMMVSVEHPVAQSDAALAAIGGKTGRVIVEGLSRVPQDGSISTWLQRLVAANQRQTPTYGVVTLYPGTPDGDRVIVDAMRYGSVLVGTGSAAMTSNSAAADAPRAAFGTYARLLGQMTRDAKAIDLREAIARITSRPAAAFRIAERGILRENAFADIVVFDPGMIADRTTADDPRQYPAGVEYVVVNGVVVLTPRGPTGSRPGHRILRGAGAR